jgi:hypothetical protein
MLCVSGSIVDPHIALLTGFPARFPQYHQGCLVRVEDLVGQQLLPECLHKIGEPSLIGRNDPVCHRLPGDGDVQPGQFLLLPVQGQGQYILVVKDMGQPTGRDDTAAGKQRGRDLAFLH